MNTRYILKVVDFVLQVLSVLIPFAWAAATGKNIYMFYAYFSLGATQFLSCLLNRLLLSGRYRAGKRFLYEIILAAYTLIALFFMWYINYSRHDFGSDMHYNIHNAEVNFIGILAFSSPFLGIWYGIISFVEIGNVSEYKEG